MKRLSRLAIGAALGLAAGCGGLALLLAAGGCLALSGDPASVWARPHVEQAVNGYLEGMRLRAAAGRLGLRDRAALHAGIALGAAIGQGISPEGAAVLWHSVHGSG